MKAGAAVIVRAKWHIKYGMAGEVLQILAWPSGVEVEVSFGGNDVFWFRANQLGVA